MIYMKTLRGELDGTMIKMFWGESCCEVQRVCEMDPLHLGLELNNKK